MSDDAPVEEDTPIDATRDDGAVSSPDESGSCGDGRSAGNEAHGGADADPAAGPEARLPPVEEFAVGPDATHEEFLAAAKLYARRVVDATDLAVTVSDLDWSVSTRSKRRAGATKYRDGEPEAVILAWRQFQAEGWATAMATLRHELVHVHLLNEVGEPGHGERFRELAAALDTHVRCKRFTDPEWWVTCEDCGERLARYRRSKLVRNPGDYACGACGGRLVVDAANGESDG